MQIFLFFTIITQIFQCKEAEVYWQPEGQFALLKDDGTYSDPGVEFFSLQTVPDSIEILVLNFFAPECKPCIDELPELEKIYKTISTIEEVDFIAIGSILTAMGEGAYADLEKVTPEVYEFKKEHKVSYKSYLATSEQLESFGISGYPETFILYRDAERNWYVKRRYISSITEKNIYPYLNL